jgi:hypothetical protein
MSTIPVLATAQSISRSWPLNLFKDRTKTFSLGGVNHLYESHSAFEMCAKVGVSIAVLEHSTAEGYDNSLLIFQTLGLEYATPQPGAHRHARA